MTTISKSIEINAPREVIRQYYAHPVHTLEWAQSVYLWEPEEAWPAVGTKAKMGIKSGGLKLEGVATTLAYDPETMQHQFRLEMKNFDPMDFHYTFDEDSGKTTVTAEINYTIPGSYLGQMLDKLFVERQNAKDLEEGLVRLKGMAEAAA